MKPDKIIQKSPGQESVWDYPRPPRIEDSQKHIQVIFNGVMIAETRRAVRVLETSHPPVYYIPPEDVRMDYFSATPRSTFCEYKGAASYYTIRVGERTEANAAWFYPRPSAPYAALANYVAVYPSRMDMCFVDGEQIQPQPGDFYGGWITKDIVGPFKGGAGTAGW
ncbi:MAG: DUF427 domain-containing protein [Chloroflexota bacterium]|nr:DUF427 domain-containing protein [Chloroflexota bacterium]